jgi:hypothetical protein
LFPYILGDIRQSADRFPGRRLNVWQFRPELVATIRSPSVKSKKYCGMNFTPPGEFALSMQENLIAALGQFYGSIMPTK